ncbi:MAG: radical SAM protein [Oscillospiraceae bacterium]|nr:radical SAM protein [Oscillospiraceae bacterium]
MNKTNISIFIPHLGCPHRCSFCDQRSISGTKKAPTPEEVFALLEEQAPRLSEKGMTAQIAFFGGSFTAIPRDYMTELLIVAKRAVERFDVYTGIRCSTRPDCIDEEILGLLKSYGMTAIELGAQSMSDEVLAANDRGHTAEDVEKAARLIRENGFELGLQMMTGLYKDAPEKSLYTAEKFIEMRPETVRIYPTVILKNTRLGELFESGVYTSFSFEETVELCATLLRKFEQNDIRVIRMGLHASDDVEREMLGGVYHPSFREIVESRLMLKDLSELLKPLPKGDYTVFTDGKNLSKLIGQKRGNLEKLREMGYRIKVKEKSGVYLEIEES